jgi:hypothetical protein
LIVLALDRLTHPVLLARAATHKFLSATIPITQRQRHGTLLVFLERHSRAFEETASNAYRGGCGVMTRNERGPQDEPAGLSQDLSRIRGVEGRQDYYKTWDMEGSRNAPAGGYSYAGS